MRWNMVEVRNEWTRSDRFDKIREAKRKAAVGGALIIFRQKLGRKSFLAAGLRQHVCNSGLI